MISTVQAETLLKEEKKNSVKVDPNFANSELEYVLSPQDENGKFLGMREGVIIYGLMVRVSDMQPIELDESKWWNDCEDVGVNLKC